MTEEEMTKYKDKWCQEAYKRGKAEAIKELQESLEEWQKTCEAKSDTNSQLVEQLADKNEQIEKLKEQLSIRFEFEDKWKRENAELKRFIKTQTEIIINYLKCSIEKCSDKHISDWLKEELNAKERWLDTINFCNTSDKDIISQALINFSNNCRAKGKHTEANKIDKVRENYLSSFEETKAVKDDCN